MQVAYAFHWDTLRWTWTVLLDGYVMATNTTNALAEAKRQALAAIEDLGGDPQAMSPVPSPLVPGRN